MTRPMTRTESMTDDARDHMLALRARMTEVATSLMIQDDLRSQVIDEINERDCYDELMRRHPETEMTDEWVIAHVLDIALTYAHDDDCRCKHCAYSPNCAICN